MKTPKKISPLSALVEQVAQIKIDKKLATVADMPFFKKKMEKGAKTLAIAGIPA